MLRILPLNILIVWLLMVGVFLLSGNDVVGYEGDHVVISEVMTYGSISTDEFVEIYNPTTSEVDLSGWKLVKQTATATSEIDLIEDIDMSIKPHGYLLFTHANSLASDSADLVYNNQSVADENSVMLKSGTEVIDLVGIGDVNASESASISKPGKNKSIERKADVDSTSESLSIGGLDELMGNGYDSDDNSQDFVIRLTPQPQNSSSTIEPELAPTPTTTPTPSATPTPTDTPTPTPSPTAIPPATPTPTIAPPPPPVPTIAPNPKPGHSFRLLNVQCTRRFVRHRFFGRTIYFPHVICLPSR